MSSDQELAASLQTQCLYDTKSETAPRFIAPSVLMKQLDVSVETGLLGDVFQLVLSYSHPEIANVRDPASLSGFPLRPKVASKLRFFREMKATPRTDEEANDPCLAVRNFCDRYLDVSMFRDAAILLWCMYPTSWEGPPADGKGKSPALIQHRHWNALCDWAQQRPATSEFQQLVWTIGKELFPPRDASGVYMKLPEWKSDQQRVALRTYGLNYKPLPVMYSTEVHDRVTAMWETDDVAMHIQRTTRDPKKQYEQTEEVKKLTAARLARIEAHKALQEKLGDEATGEDVNDDIDDDFKAAGIDIKQYFADENELVKDFVVPDDEDPETWERGVKQPKKRSSEKSDKKTKAEMARIDRKLDREMDRLNAASAAAAASADMSDGNEDYSPDETESESEPSNDVKASDDDETESESEEEKLPTVASSSSAAAAAVPAKKKRASETAGDRPAKKMKRSVEDVLASIAAKKALGEKLRANAEKAKSAPDVPVVEASTVSTVVAAAVALPPTDEGKRSFDDMMVALWKEKLAARVSVAPVAKPTVVRRVQPTVVAVDASITVAAAIAAASAAAATS